MEKKSCNELFAISNWFNALSSIWNIVACLDRLKPWLTTGGYEQSPPSCCVRYNCWHCVRMVKEMDLKSIGLSPQGFEPPQCRYIYDKCKTCLHFYLQVWTFWNVPQYWFPQTTRTGAAGVAIRDMCLSSTINAQVLNLSRSQTTKKQCKRVPPRPRGCIYPVWLKLG